MSFTEEHKAFIKEKIRLLLPSSKIYLFYAYGKDFERQGETDLMVFGERELSVNEKTEIRTSLWRLLGGKGFNISSYKHGYESDDIKYALIEGVEL